MVGRRTGRGRISRCRTSRLASAAMLDAAKWRIKFKTLPYLMGHSDIGVTLNAYTHLGLEDTADELKRVEERTDARKEREKIKGENPVL